MCLQIACISKRRITLVAFVSHILWKTTGEEGGSGVALISVMILVDQLGLSMENDWITGVSCGEASEFDFFLLWIFRWVFKLPASEFVSHILWKTTGEEGGSGAVTDGVYANNSRMVCTCSLSVVLLVFL